MPLVEQELLTLPEHLRSPPVFSAWGSCHSIFSLREREREREIERERERDFIKSIKKPVRAQNYRHLHFTLTMILMISNIYDIYKKE